MSRRGAKAALAALSLAVSLGLGAAAAVAAPGDLDPTFGDAGKVDTGDGGYFPDVAVDHQGRIVMLANQKILRFDPDGQPDQSFGTDGVADYPPISALGSVAVASDDGILVGGWGRKTDGGDQTFMVARYDESGELDPSFGDGGVGFAPVSSEDDLGYLMAVGPDESTYVSGFSADIGGPQFAVVAAFNPDGTPNRSFGRNAVKRIRVPGVHSSRAIAVQPDGKIVVQLDASGLALARLRPQHGGLDRSFGDDGVVSAPVGGVRVAALAIQSDGRIVGAGLDSRGRSTEKYYYDNDAWGFVRIQPDGSLDPSFSKDGVRIFDPAKSADTRDGVKDVALQPNGRIVSAGIVTRCRQEEIFIRCYDTFAVGRLRPGGGLDRRFGEQGIATVPFGSDTDVSTATAVALQDDGRIVAAGFYQPYDSENSERRGVLAGLLPN